MGTNIIFYVFCEFSAFMAWHQVFSLYFDNRADKAANGKCGKASAHATASTAASTAAANWQLATGTALVCDCFREGYWRGDLVICPGGAR